MPIELAVAWHAGAVVAGERGDKQRLRRRGSFTWLMIVSMSVIGCAQQRPPADLLGDRDVSLSRRVEVVGQVDAGAERALLLRVLWDESEPTELRLRALESLSQAEPTLLTLAAGDRLESIAEPRVAEAVCREIARPSRVAALPGVMKRWSLPWPHGSPRPEPATITAMTGEADALLVAQQVVLGSWPTDVRVAAWSVLVREQNRETIKRWLTQGVARPGDALVADLRAAVGLLDEWPTGKLAVLWLMMRRGGDAWADTERQASKLSHAEREGLALRHLPPLTVLGVDRARQVVAVADDALPAEGVVIRDDEDTTLGHLHWPDRLIASAVFDALGEPTLRAELFEQADADRLDTTSEYGGVLGWSSDRRFTASAFPPLRGSHDRAYLAPPDLLLDAFEGLAIHHFHAERTDNTEHAGPAQGDRALAAKTGLAVVILTTLGRDALNVDVLFPCGRCVDLGTIERP